MRSARRSRRRVTMLRDPGQSMFVPYRDVWKYEAMGWRLASECGFSDWIVRAGWK